MDDRDNAIGQAPGRNKTTENPTMNLPSGKLMALVAVFAAIGVITGTGAFTTVTAERTATVNVAGDANALLALNPTSDYAELNNNDQLEIDISSSSAVSGNGLNPNAKTTIEGVFTITNQGSQEVYVYINGLGENPGYVNFYNGSVSGGANVTDTENAQKLGVGEQMSISMEIDLVDSGLDSDDTLLDNIEIVAEDEDPSP